MLKKLYSILIIFLISLALISCANNQNKEIELPVLNGQSITEITNTLNGLGVTFEILEEVNLNVTEGTFIKYGNNLAAGMKVNIKDTPLIVYVSIHKILLPDLSGKTETQATLLLRGLDLQVSISYLDTTEQEEGHFIRYGGTFYVGQELQKNSIVSIVVARYPEEYRSPIFISKYMSGTGFNRAIEIYNSLDTEVSLDNYKLDFYLDGSLTVSNSYSFPEDTTLGANDSILLVHPNASNELKAKADILTDSLTYVGKDYIKLLDHKNAFIDEFGLYTQYVLNFNNRIMVRKENIIESNLVFTLNEWDVYHHDYIDALDEHPRPFPTTFTYLPEDLELDYFTEPRGMVLVTHNYSNDGDTSYFNPHFLGDNRVRYVAINTPEMTTNPPEPHAQAATTFLNNLLDNATEIYIQHDPHSGIIDHYNRSLGLVWADGVLVNYLIILNGYSQNNYNDPNNIMVFNGVTLNEWFRRAEASAKAQKLGIWS